MGGTASGAAVTRFLTVGWGAGQMQIRGHEVHAAAYRNNPALPAPGTYHCELATVPIDSLLSADSPRLSGVEEDHVYALAATDRELPPLLVHRDTMRVIDGMHRLHAARLNGQQEMRVHFFDGDEDDAFLMSVQLNVTHGLPLSLADRAAAAERILRGRPHLSDRMIANLAGLSAATVASVRTRATAHSWQSNVRLGKDGRVRPLSTAEGRRRAGEFINACPGASLRQIAAVSGISVGTARDVRERMRKGQPPELPSQRSEPPVPPVVPLAVEVSTILDRLCRDPALRYNDQGRELLQWLRSHLVKAADLTAYVEAIPEHCAPVVAALAERYAQAWRSLAEELAR